MTCFYCGRPPEPGTVLCSSCRCGEEPEGVRPIMVQLREAAMPAPLRRPRHDPPVWAIPLIAFGVFVAVVLMGLWGSALGSMMTAARAVTQP